MGKMEIRRLTPAIGAEICDLDLSKPLSNAQWLDVHDAFLTHQVLVFRDQALTAESMVDLARRFGRIGAYPFLKSLDGHPEITEVIKEAEEKINFGGLWHTDTSYLETPPMGSLLYAKEVPPVGGDTLFANMYMAFDTLSPALRDWLRGVKVVNRSDKAAAAATRVEQIGRIGAAENAKPVYEAIHPLVRTHPETGRPSLYAHIGHSVRFEGMSEEESAPMLNYLFQHQIRPEFQCRIAWRPGTLTVWDNRCTLHNAMNDYHGHRRHMWRITIEGDRPS